MEALHPLSGDKAFRSGGGSAVRLKNPRPGSPHSLEGRGNSFFPRGGGAGELTPGPRLTPGTLSGVPPSSSSWSLALGGRGCDL